MPPDLADGQVFRASGEGLVSALTFDDGPNGDTTEDLLDFLSAQRIRAVFAVVGSSITASGGSVVLRRIVGDGHVLCNHTTSFADMGEWEPNDVERDLAENLRIIRDAAGAEVAVPYFRAPNGNWGRTIPVALALGMRPLAVVNTIGDWSVQDPEALTASLRAAMRPGELVVAHDGGGDRRGTVAAVRAVVTERLAQGWRFTLPVQ